MKTVQLAIGNTEYAQSLGTLLERDGTHRVYMVDVPDLRLDGVVVLDGTRPENLALLDSEPERFVVITRKGSDYLARIWDAGVRHVLFDVDPPNTAQLAIIAAELRLPTARPARPVLKGEADHGRHHVSFPVLARNTRAERSRLTGELMDPAKGL